MMQYYWLIKPGIIAGNLVTFAAGFALARGEESSWLLFFASLFALAAMIASGCVFNNYIDRDVDRSMERTNKRPLATGTVGVAGALFFGGLLYLFANTLFILFCNTKALLAANLGFFVYVFPYSLLKSRTVYSTLIGSISGAVPPVVGYAAASDRLDLGAFLLFFVLVFWQMPHFYAIGLWRVEDYKKANIPILPVAKGALATKVHIVLYILALVAAFGLLTYAGYTGSLFFVLTLSLGVLWGAAALAGFQTACDQRWAKQMFQLSLVVINAFSLLVFFERM